MRRSGPSVALFVAALTAGPAFAAPAPDIMREWASVRAPSPPQLATVTVDPKTTALLIISFDKMVCSAADRKRCPPAIPKVKSLLDSARAQGMMVVHGYATAQMPSDVQPDLVPIDGEPIVHAPADKFLNSGLADILRAHGIGNVIVAGTAGNGAVLFTVVGGATQGFDLIVPADTMPADSAYHEQYALVEMNDIGFLHQHVKLTSSDRIVFQSAPAPPRGDDPDVLRAWPAITPPVAPEITHATLDAAKSALLVMDFNKANCTPEKRPLRRSDSKGTRPTFLRPCETSVRRARDYGGHEARRRSARARAGCGRTRDPGAGRQILRVRIGKDAEG